VEFFIAFHRNTCPAEWLWTAVGAALAGKVRLFVLTFPALLPQNAL